MASRTIQTTPEVDSALNYLARKAGVDADEYFEEKISDVLAAALKEAEVGRFNAVTELMKGDDKAKSLAAIKDILAL